MAVPEMLGVRWLRRKLLTRAGQTTGRPLEVAHGTGMNFRFLPRTIGLVAADLSRKMIETARRRAHALGLEVAFAFRGGKQLAIRD